MDLMEIIVDVIKEGFKDVIDGDLNDFSFDLGNMNMCEEIAEGFGLEREDLDQNGWDADYWLRMKDNKNNHFTITGSGFYGGIGITREDD